MKVINQKNKKLLLKNNKMIKMINKENANNNDLLLEYFKFYKLLKKIKYL